MLKIKAVIVSTSSENAAAKIFEKQQVCSLIFSMKMFISPNSGFKGLEYSDN